MAVTVSLINTTTKSTNKCVQCDLDRDNGVQDIKVFGLTFFIGYLRTTYVYKGAKVVNHRNRQYQCVLKKAQIAHVLIIAC